MKMSANHRRIRLFDYAHGEELLFGNNSNRLRESYTGRKKILYIRARYSVNYSRFLRIATLVSVSHYSNRSDGVFNDSYSNAVITVLLLFRA